MLLAPKKNRQAPTDEALGRSRGGFSTKIHLAVDAVGKPLKFLFTAGQESDIAQAEALIAGEGAKCIVADKGYDSQAFVDVILQQGAKPVVPSRSTNLVQRKVDKNIYRERNRIERFINRLKHFRRVATRYEKTVRNFAAMVYCAAALILLK